MRTANANPLTQAPDMLAFPITSWPVRAWPQNAWPDDARSYWIYQRPTPTGPDTLLVTLPPGTSSYALTGEPNSEAFVYARAMSACGVLDNESLARKLKRVAFDGDGNFIAPVPNAPFGLHLVVKAGGVISVKFGHSNNRADVDADHFQLYVGTDGGELVAGDTIAASGGRSYSIDLDAEAHGTLVTVRVRAVAASGAEEQNDVRVSAVADDQAPAAPTGLSVEVTGE